MRGKSQSGPNRLHIQNLSYLCLSERVYVGNEHSEKKVSCCLQWGDLSQRASLGEGGLKVLPLNPQVFS